MSTARGRSAVVAVLAAVVGARVAASGPLDPATARIAADPSAVLDQVTDGWSSAGTLGSATAQAVRELVPAGYYGAGGWLGVPAEVLATGFRAAVMVLAVLGAVRVALAVAARLIRPGGESADPGRAEPWTPWVAAVLYAVGPVLVATLVRSPSDAVALAVLPWVLAPLLGDRAGWRTAASSAAWLGLAGLAHPLWSLTVLLVGCLAALLRVREAPGQVLRWLVLAAAASAWWLVALAHDLRHAEDLGGLLAPVSVSAGLADALAWPGLGGPWPVLLAAGTLAVVVAAAALRVPGVPRLAGVLLAVGVVGLLALGSGWVPPLAVAAPGSAAPALLGPPLACAALAALLAWVPLAEHGMRAVRAAWPPTHRPGARDVLAGGLAVLVVATSAAGFVVAVQERGPGEPDHDDLWAAVADWSASAPPGRVLVAPAGADSPGLTRALAGRPWVSRTPAPVHGAAATAAVDDVLARLARGLGGPGTEEALRRLGVSYVLLRADGAVEEDRSRPAALVREALREQGAQRVAALTEDGDSAAPGLVDHGVRSRTPQVEVWELRTPGTATLYPGDRLAVAGDAGAVADLADAGLGSRALRLVGEDRTPELVSDSARRRDLDQRRAADPYGRDLSGDEPRSVVPSGAAPAVTASRALTGARSVTSSSSAADLGQPDRRAGSDALAAVDGSVFTAWTAAAGEDVGAWWQIELEQQVDLSAATAQFLGNRISGYPVSRVRLETDAETVEREVGADGVLDLGLGGAVSRLRITITAVRETSGSARVGITEVTAPGLTVRSRLTVPGRPGAGWLLAARPGSHDRCVPAPAADGEAPADLVTVCGSGLSVEGRDAGSLRREVTSADPVSVDGSVWARASETRQTGELADRLAAPRVVATGSSVVAADLETRPQAAADGDPATAWRPAVEDDRPSLLLSWRRSARVSGLELVAPPGDLWARPTRVLVEPVWQAEHGERVSGPQEAEVGPDGTVSLSPVRTRALRVTVLEDSGVVSRDSVAGWHQEVPVALAEVRLVGGPANDYDAATVHELGCGQGPQVAVDGTTVQTTLRASAGDLVEGRTLHARFCTEARLPGGAAQVSVPASFTWTPLGLVLARAGAASAALDAVGEAGPAASGRTISLTEPRDAQRLTLVRGGQGPQTLALAVPRHEGWVAESDGEPLEPLTVDGWAQGWLVPEGTAEVELRYSAGEGLAPLALAGAAGWLVVLAVALSAVPGRLRRARPWDQAIAGVSTQA